MYPTSISPDTLRLSRDTGVSRRYERGNFRRYDEAVAAGDFAFPVGDGALDDRLGAVDGVVGVAVAGTTVAYPPPGWTARSHMRSTVSSSS